jgi:hypothetical protein
MAPTSDANIIQTLFQGYEANNEFWKIAKCSIEQSTNSIAGIMRQMLSSLPYKSGHGNDGHSGAKKY